MNDLEFFYNRLVQLRMERNISARDMSVSLGHCESYINKIENKKSLPSLPIFFDICHFLNIHPSDFFSNDIQDTLLSKEYVKEFNSLNEEQKEHVLSIIRDINKHNTL